MRNITVAVAPINATIGAVNSNTNQVIEAADWLSDQGVSVAGFPEQVIGGYPAEDLTKFGQFLDKQWQNLLRFAESNKAHVTPTVFTVGLTVCHNGHPYNCVAVVGSGRIYGIVPKEELPSYNVFDESRQFTRGIPGYVGEVDGIPFGDLIFTFPWGTLGVAVCEDIWRDSSVLYRRACAGAEIIMVASASPFRVGVEETRKRILCQRSSDNLIAVAYTNMLGGNGSLVFDGGGYFAQNGEMVPAEIDSFETMPYDTVTLDLGEIQSARRQNSTWRDGARCFIKEACPKPQTVDCRGFKEFQGYRDVHISLPGYVSPLDRVRQAQNQLPQSTIGEYFDSMSKAISLGLQDYRAKCGIPKFVLALSGGRDSVLAAIELFLSFHRNEDRPRYENSAAAENDVICWSMPTRFNSDSTREVSRDLCNVLRLTFEESSIETQFESERAAIEEKLGPLNRIARQNLQARIRGGRILTVANQLNGLVIRTSNRTETAVGYFTLGGDGEGGLAIFSSVPKTVINAWLEYYISDFSPIGDYLDENEFKFFVDIIEEMLKTAASAELDEDQSDERDLMPFAIMDDAYEMLMGKHLSPSDIYLRLRSTYDDWQLKEMSPSYQRGQLKVWVKKFMTLFFTQVFKWVQVSEGLHLADPDPDHNRAMQLPTVHSLEWLDLGELDSLPD